MARRLAAFGVHIFTALGVAMGFQALVEAAAHRWEAAFGWLGIALIIDGLDGPIARRLAVAETLPRFSGERLDLIIDYLTYVIVPAYMVHEARLVPPQLASVAAIMMLLSSLYHFIDRQSKTEDGFFVGFPATWNVIALYLFIFDLPLGIAFAVLLLFAVLTFFPLKWVHPIRVKLMRPVTIAVMIAWAIATFITLAEGFPGSLAAQATIAVSSLYMAAIGIARSVQRRREPAAFD
jgi:phosphatidylcholine synthase